MMRRLLGLLSTALALLAVLALPASALAVDYGVIHDYCGGPYGWTANFKASVISEDTSSVNKLTIDSWIQARDPGHPRWYRAQSWPRVSTSFTPDGTYHHLTLGRHATGGVDVGVRVVYRMTAWDHGLIAWTQTIHGVTC